MFRNPNSFNIFPCRIEYFKNSFLPWVISDWNELEPKIDNYNSYLSFRNTPRNFIIPSENKISNIYDEVGIKPLTRVRLGFEHIIEQKDIHVFDDTSNPPYPRSIKPEWITHFFLRQHFYNIFWTSFTNGLLSIDSSRPTENDKNFLDILLYRNSKFNTKTDQNVLIFTLKSIKGSPRSDNSHF